MRYIDPDFAARRHAFFVVFAASTALSMAMAPDTSVYNAGSRALFAGLAGALALGVFHSALDWLVDTFEKRAERRLALANREAADV